MYNTLLFLSRNIFFYDKIKLPDTYETRLYLMFLHFSIVLIIYKKKKLLFNQKSYDLLFQNIENNLRELGFGDVSVNKKMKEINKTLYDILLKLDISSNTNKFKINPALIMKYFNQLNTSENTEYVHLETYFNKFFHFCFEHSLDNMIEKIKNFKI